MDNHNQQDQSDMQKSAKEFVKSGAELAKHATSAVKTGVNLAASKIEDAAGENGARAFQQAKEKVSTGVNAAAKKIEDAAAGSNSELLKKATASRKKTVIVLVCAVALLVIGISSIFGGEKISSPEEAEAYALKHISEYVTYDAKINETPGFELFALGKMDKKQAILKVSTNTGEVVEGYHLVYMEGPNMYDVIVTYKGDLYYYMVGTQSSTTTAKTAKYVKLYDVKKGWD